ncbi:hypothetical protein ACILG0_12055 [Pseudomonadota bacterium AL_CKDN230030165-1A_HGKHYDSX7]
MKEHAGTSFVSTLEIVQPDIASFCWRVITVDEVAGAVVRITDGRKRYATQSQALADGKATMEALDFSS